MTKFEGVGVEQMTQTRGELRQWKSPEGCFLGWDGLVWTPHGAVSVISSVRTHSVLYRFAHAGRLHRCNVEGTAAASPRVLARDARRFAEAVIHTIR